MGWGGESRVRSRFDPRSIYTRSDFSTFARPQLVASFASSDDATRWTLPSASHRSGTRGALCLSLSLLLSRAEFSIMIVTRVRLRLTLTGIV